MDDETIIKLNEISEYVQYAFDCVDNSEYPASQKDVRLAMNACGAAMTRIKDLLGSSYTDTFDESIDWEEYRGFIV